LNVTGQATARDCLKCPPGYYCGGTALPGPTGPCDPGHYCTGGAESPRQFIAPNGTYAPAGSSFPVQCLPGTFNNEYAQARCPPCPAGFFCEDPGMTVPTTCPAGSYCDTGSNVPTQCSAGTFNPQTGALSRLACTNCTAGMFCPTSGLIAPTGLCDSGHLCTTGSSLSDPVGEIFGDVCPPGYFCP